MYKEIFLIGTTIAIVDCLASSAYEHNERRLLMQEARAYADSKNKPVLNAGCGNNPRILGDVNCDILETSYLPNYIQADIENLPFEDKQFGAAVAFHSIEHLNDPQKGLVELDRVADRTYVALPAPFNFFADTRTDHKYASTGLDCQLRPNNPILKTIFYLTILGGLAYLAYKEEKEKHYK